VKLGWTADRAIRILSPAARAAFAANPLRFLREDLHFQVKAVENLSQQRNDGGFCDGVSFIDDGVILYAPTPNSRRENFTLAHELAHWLVTQETTVFDWIANQAEPEVILETVCDRIAAQLLLPNEIVNSIIMNGPVRAQSVVDLFGASNASWPACAIALAQHLPGLGAIVLIDRYASMVSHASVNPDPNEGWPLIFPWRNQPVADWHPLMKLEPGATLSRRISWRTPWDKSHDYFANAVADDRRIIAVFSDVDVWSEERQHIETPREFDKRPLGKIYCCGQERWVRGYPCPTCHEQFCPQCKGCRCTRASKRAAQCSNCFMELQPQLLEDGLCELCR